MMSSASTEDGLSIRHEYVAPRQIVSGSVRCGICQRALRWSSLHVEEVDSVYALLPVEDEMECPLRQHSWVLCQACLDAVQAQLRQSIIRNPAKVRIAIGIVVTQRAPEFRPPLAERIEEQILDNFFPVALGITLFLHILLAIFIGLVR